MIEEEVPAALARLSVAYVAEDEEALAMAADHGVTVNDKAPELDALLEEYKKSEIAAAVAKATERGAVGAQALADTFVENLAKWKKISEETGPAPGDLLQAGQLRAAD
jgi:hypothetical protein